MTRAAHHGRWARSARVGAAVVTLTSPLWCAAFASAQIGANRASDTRPAATPAIERQRLGPASDVSSRDDIAGADRLIDARDTRPAAGAPGAASATAPRPQTPGAPESPGAHGDASSAEHRDTGVGAAAESTDDRLLRVAQRLASPASGEAAPVNGSTGAGQSRSGSTDEVGATAAPLAVDRESAAGSGAREIEPGAAAEREAAIAAATVLEQQSLGPRGDAGAPVQMKTPPRESGNWVINTLGALGLVIGLVFMLRWGMMRMSGRASGGGASSVVEVLARVPVAARSHVLLLRMGGRILVVGDGAGGMRTLAQVDEPEEVADLLAAVTASRPNSATQTFRQLFDRFNGDYRDEGDAAEEGGERHEFHMDRTRDRLSGLIGRVRSIGRKGGA